MLSSRVRAVCGALVCSAVLLTSCSADTPSNLDYDASTFGLSVQRLIQDDTFPIEGIDKDYSLVSLSQGRNDHEVYAVGVKNDKRKLYAISFDRVEKKAQAEEIVQARVKYSEDVGISQRKDRYFDNVADVFVPTLAIAGKGNSYTTPVSDDGWFIADGMMSGFYDRPWLDYVRSESDDKAIKDYDGLILHQPIFDAVVKDDSVDTRSVITGGCAVPAHEDEALEVDDKAFIPKNLSDTGRKAMEGVLDARRGSPGVVTSSGGPDLALRDSTSMMVQGSMPVTIGSIAPQGSILDPSVGLNTGGSGVGQLSNDANAEKNTSVFVAGLKSMSCLSTPATEKNNDPLFIGVDRGLSDRYVDQLSGDFETLRLSKDNFYEIPDTIVGVDVSVKNSFVESLFSVEDKALAEKIAGRIVRIKNDDGDIYRVGLDTTGDKPVLIGFVDG